MSTQAEIDQKFLQLALEQAKKGYSENGIPIGAVLVSADGKVLGAGHNQRLQKGSAILHGEMDALEKAGRLPGSAYKGATMYSTLSPCNMCTGACLLYGINRVVFGENKTFVGGEDLLRSKGAEVINLENEECYDLMQKFIAERPQDWNEDIGV
ncbi:similar to Saccharomyces cerevisiae YPR062W FCY1 Cytosine deaminase, zinc metalloenzyme that catalyzes the hydrolytic deamination of cytosine to uracil [Geotrichum candidum]|uniref:Cytosine deaminase n=1 Tax=Geotrichum candidum TaxID=1173061 RepID=A0A0J9XGC4_GEOCN|nr:similar to Saccharomyces cerevisiae YPR062W FCY1 Cytosine deaminase, zinc metalloenzyme that catalyzes the hydrolytic deamination of cytosine to uracil [Geotrichum candidum]